jgi:hypothetical protein
MHISQLLFESCDSCVHAFQFIPPAVFILSGRNIIIHGRTCIIALSPMFDISSLLYALCFHSINTFRIGAVTCSDMIRNRVRLSCYRPNSREICMIARSLEPSRRLWNFLQPKQMSINRNSAAHPTKLRRHPFHFIHHPSCSLSESFAICRVTLHKYLQI